MPTGNRCNRKGTNCRKRICEQCRRFEEEIRVAKLLIVDDEEAMRKLLRLNLSDSYEIVDTGQPEEALALVLEHKPDAILLDLRMPKYSGFELCQTLTSLSSTQLTPVLVISGEAGSNTKDFCRGLGVAAYFEKPVDFTALHERLAELLTGGRRERRSEVRVRLNVPLRLRGKDAEGKAFEALTTSENVSLNGFLCACGANLSIDSIIDVYLVGSSEQLVGKARIARSESKNTEYPRYGCRFVEKIGNWVLQ
jgi:DNA-binding response OmpR family regulator